MNIFKFKENIKNTIPFMALIIAINTILIFVASYVPLIGYIFLLFLPLISTHYSVLTRKRYFPIYLILNILICLLVTTFDFTLIFIYLIPSLLQGFVFSLSIKNKLNGYICYLLSILILFICKIIFIPVIDKIYNVNTINTLLTIFGLISLENINNFIYSIIFTLSSIEVLLIFIVLNSDIKKLGYQLTFNDKNNLLIFSISSFASILVSVIFYLLNIYNLANLFLEISLFISVFLSIKLCETKKIINYIIIVAFIIVSYLSFVILIPYLGESKALIMLNLFPIFLLILNIVYYIIEKRSTNGSTT